MIKNKLLIACALKRESTALQERLQVNCRFLVTGLGARRTRKSLEETCQSEPPSLLIFTGTAGQLDPSLGMGQVIFPQKWCLEDGSCFSADVQLTSLLRDRDGWEIEGCGLTVSSAVLRAKSRLALYRKCGARICDMESAVALQVASRHGVPCLAPKIVSDTAQSGMSAFWKEFDSNMDQLAKYLDRLIAALESEV
jgi:nucleoside phosphorylase